MIRFFVGSCLIALSLSAGVINISPQLGAAGNITDAAFNPSATHSGVARLTFSNGALCSGVAIAPTVVLTAAHCIGGAGNGASAFFTDSGSNSQNFSSSSFLIFPGWSGDAATQVDLALVYLTSPLAAWVSIYELYSNTDELGQNYQVAGWGEQASNGQAQGTVAGPHAGLRVGNNIWDSTFVNFNPFPNRNDVLISDFDTAAFGVANEVTVAPGDSGGPSFLGGRVAGVTSFTAALGQAPTGAFGEFNGITRVSSHLSWIQTNAGIQAVPEPASFGMMGFAIYWIWAAKRRSGVNS